MRFRPRSKGVFDMVPTIDIHGYCSVSREVSGSMLAVVSRRHTYPRIPITVNYRRVDDSHGVGQAYLPFPIMVGFGDLEYLPSAVT